jgi:cell fate (sporulation/competence/biofilm development) regulator YlbF (YheA/YmcA/DUF963 family)
MDRDEMSNNRGLSIDASYQVSVHLAKRFQRTEESKESANQKQELPSYQVSVHLAERFQRRKLKCEKLMDDGRQVMAKAHFAFGKVS